MEYYSVNMNRNYLYHHGIMKQKWGVRHGPPYPLSYDKHSSAQKAANPKNVIDGNSEKRDHKSLTDSQKKAIKIGAIAVGASLAVVGGVMLYKSGKLDGLTKIGHNAVKDMRIGANIELNDSGIGKDLHLKHGVESLKDTVAEVNRLSGHERSNSCVQTALATTFSRPPFNMLCTAKADLDVNGIGRTHRILEVLAEVFPELQDTNSKNLRTFSNTDIISSRSKMEEKLKQWYGDNASGIIATNVRNELKVLAGG